MVASAVQGIDLFEIAGRSSGLRASRRAILVMSGNHSVARWKSDSFFICSITLSWPATLVATLVLSLRPPTNCPRLSLRSLPLALSLTATPMTLCPMVWAP
jgi:hypothetical protein